MKLIKPSEISARILTLLDKRDERVIIVSPYMKISKWYKFVNKVNELKTRRVLTEIYVRDDPDNTATYRNLDQLALQYKKILHLHSKLYLNVKPARVSRLRIEVDENKGGAIKFAFHLESGYAIENCLAMYDELVKRKLIFKS